MRWKIGAFILILLLPLAAHADPISAAVVAAIGIEAGTTAAVVVGTIITIGLSQALGAVTRLLMPKPNMATRVTVREALAPRRTVYGFYHGPGTVVYLWSTQPETNWLEEIHVFAAHECERVGSLYLDKLLCVNNTTDGRVTGGQSQPDGSAFPYSGLAFFHYKTGAEDDRVYNTSNMGATSSCSHWNLQGGACSDAARTGAYPMLRPNPEWTAECKLLGLASISVSLHRSDHFSGIPSITIDLWGKKVFDPRTDATAWSDNPALCYLDYLITPRLEGGFGATLAEIDTDLFIAAANICDESADTLGINTTIFAIDPTGDPDTYQIIVNDPRGIFADTPLTIGSETTSVIAISGNAFTCLLSNSHSVGESVTGGPSGAEKRFTCNGIYTWDMAPAEIMTQILSSFGGIPTYINGKYGIYAAAWRPPQPIPLTEADLRAPIKVQTLRSARDLANGMRGTFINITTGQPDDLPPVICRIDPTNPDVTLANDFYLQQDNGYRRWRDVQLPFTNSASMGQRLLRILLEQNRHQISVEWPGNMSCYQFTAPDTVVLSNDRFGWSDKTFQVITTRLVIEQDKNNSPYLATDLTLQETDPGVYEGPGGGGGSSGTGSQPTSPAGANIYPLTMPSPAPRSLSLTANNLAGESRGEFDGISQVQDWMTEWWEGSLTWGPMKRDQAEAVLSWATSLRGTVGTFTLPAYACSLPRGTATSGVVSGSHSAGARVVNLAIDGTLSAGDYISIAHGLDYPRLHKVLEDTSGGPVEIFPNLRTELFGGEPVIVVNPVGTFRLAENKREWAVDEAQIFGIALNIREAMEVHEHIVRPPPIGGGGFGFYAEQLPHPMISGLPTSPPAGIIPTSVTAMSLTLSTYVEP